MPRTAASRAVVPPRFVVSGFAVSCGLPGPAPAACVPAVVEEVGRRPGGAAVGVGGPRLGRRGRRFLRPRPLGGWHPRRRSGVRVLATVDVVSSVDSLRRRRRAGASGNGADAPSAAGAVSGVRARRRGRAPFPVSPFSSSRSAARHLRTGGSSPMGPPSVGRSCAVPVSHGFAVAVSAPPDSARLSNRLAARHRDSRRPRYLRCGPPAGPRPADRARHASRRERNPRGCAAGPPRAYGSGHRSWRRWDPGGRPVGLRRAYGTGYRRWNPHGGPKAPTRPAYGTGYRRRRARGPAVGGAGAGRGPVRQEPSGQDLPGGPSVDTRAFTSSPSPAPRWRTA